ncbi:hypothetical protein [Thermoleptolyngbya oregonensis]|nr:hypothetical protein [Thermoleptolyngbya oregonensis]
MRQAPGTKGELKGRQAVGLSLILGDSPATLPRPPHLAKVH